MVDEFLRCGITDAVLAPGSRSTPLALALADAERRGEICLHVRLDERSAGYLALGLGKVTGIPAIVVTTSGTAAVNLHPAVVEADESAVPLIAVTADRPPTLRGVGANQTIDQPGLFGGAVRLALDLGVAQRVPGQVRYWRSTVARAVAAATETGRPGPVHLNVPFADPLVPDDDAAWVEDLDGRPDGRPWTADARLLGGLSTPLDDVLEPLIGEAGVPARGLIVVGDHDDLDDIGLVDDLADALGWPVIAEPSGNAASCTTVLSHGPLLLADAAFAEAHVPDLVITVGRVGLSRAVLRTVARAGLHLAVDARPAWTDPTRTADLVVTSVPLAPEAAEVDAAWLESWQRADVLAAAAVETALAGFTGVQVARTVAGRVPDGGLFFIGASWPVRHVASFAATSAPDALVLGNRGTSGIDGCLSTAWGAAVALQRGGGAGAIALVGDHTFLYDSNALLVPGEDERPDLAIVVIDNDGGGIFASLEQGAPAFEETFDRVFGVPLGADLPALCGAFGIPVATTDSAEGLADALDDALGAGGVRVIVARTASRRDEARMLTDVQAAVGSALAAG